MGGGRSEGRPTDVGRPVATGTDAYNLIPTHAKRRYEIGRVRVEQRGAARDTASAREDPALGLNGG